MSGARRMQELKYIRDGATLVISLDGLDWLTKRRCSDKGIKKRNEELQLLISSGQMILADEELRAITCILEQRGRAAPQLWRNSDCRSSLVTRPPAFSTPPQHCCVPEEPPHHSTLNYFVSERPKEAQWTRLILNMKDIFSLIKKDVDIMTEQDTVTTDLENRLIIFCDEDIPLQRFGDICYTEDCGPSKGDTGWHISDNISTAHGPNTNNPNGNQRELVISDSFNNLKMLQKSCQIYDVPGVLCGRDTNLKKRKSVSFNDDVIVYLFDQSPTVEPHSETCTSLPDVALEDSGLEWEDDFSALEKNCHFQCVRHSQQYPRSLATQTSTALSRRFFLSQTCLFLTHVTESDLEL